MAEVEAAVLDALLELLIVVALVDVSIAKVESLLVDVSLDVLEQLLYVFNDAVERACLLLESIATHDLDSVLLEVATAHNETYRHTLQLVVGELEARTLVICVVVLHADACCAQLADNRSELL